MSLSPILAILDDISNTPSRLKKEEIIEGHLTNSDFKKVVKYALNPFWQYKTKRVDYFEGLDQVFIDEYHDDAHENIFHMLDHLNENKGASNDDIEWLSKFASYDVETVEVVRRIINKDLRCGASVKTFRKFFPNIPDFGVMLCKNDLSKFLKLCNNDMSKAVYSLKMNGVRCLANDGVYLSRSGKEYLNFGIFDNELAKFDEIGRELLPKIFQDGPVAKDGEVMATGDEKRTFQKLMTQVRRLNENDNSYLKFHIFDLAMDGVSFGNRYKIIYNIFKKAKEDGIEFNHITYVKHDLCNSLFDCEDDIWEYVRKIKEDGEEGLVLKTLDGPYERKKSQHWCKVKIFDTLDCHVTGFEYGNGKYSECIGALKCKLKDGTTFNASGLTDKERVDFMDNLPEVIEVKYQEWSDDGVPVFATFVRVRDDKDITDID